jgi:hypothetical protein
LSFLGRDKKFLWMAPGVYVLSHHFYGGSDPWGLVLGVPGGAKLLVRVRSGTAAEVVTATCDFIVRLLATSEEHGVYIRGCSDGVSNPLSGAGLSLFFQESQSCLRHVTLNYMALDEEQCRALANMSRLDVKLDIYQCSLADDAAGAFVECLHSDRGPIELNYCGIDTQISPTL